MRQPKPALPGERSQAGAAPEGVAVSAILVLAIRKLDGNSAVKAFVDIRIGGVTIKGAKVVKQDNARPWLAMPTLKSDRAWQNVVELSNQPLRARATAVMPAAWADASACRAAGARAAGSRGVG